MLLNFNHADFVFCQVFITADLDQIKLDVSNGRTDPECMNTPVLADSIRDLYPDVQVWRTTLVNVLTAYVRRNHSPGYCQVPMATWINARHRPPTLILL